MPPATPKFAYGFAVLKKVESFQKVYKHVLNMSNTIWTLKGWKH